MDAKNLFDAEEYFAGLCASNKLAAASGFKFCTCSGIESLQGPLELFSTDKAFFCVDDTNDALLFQGKSGGWYKKRVFTVFLMHRYDFGLEPSRKAALAICRKLYFQIVSRLIVDAESLENELVYLRTDNVHSRELGQYFLNGCTGLYFMTEVSEPVDLTFDESEWNG